MKGACGTAKVWVLPQTAEPGGFSQAAASSCFCRRSLYVVPFSWFVSCRRGPQQRGYDLLRE